MSYLFATEMLFEVVVLSTVLLFATFVEEFALLSGHFFLVDIVEALKKTQPRLIILLTP